MAEPQLLACNDPGIISLFQALDDFYKTEQAKKIENLKREKKTLKREIRHCRRVWYSTITLLRTSFDDVLTIQSALEDYDEQKRLAHQDRMKALGISNPLQNANFERRDWV
ncbi:hypothetical protein K469DRAFT_589465 [Zopfia rhizophila CBS 207.26]|uniref:Uncharacterized protein n=1 Tax=Zopfia rhizophila CBS 207.26 TaxID=1314779 RepID=A0A6A6DNW5_9PEZI|nr:hypothetical protein K469DRAFT_589465 [Zopfia rhizophila CBS 207.26]